MRYIASDDGWNVFEFRNETGEGVITLYEVLPGITIGFNDFHMRYYDSEFEPNGQLFCIDHCREGRIEYASRENAYSYVEAGDLKLDRRLKHTGRFEMPLSHYHGVMIGFEMPKAQETLKREYPDFPIDIAKLQDKYCPETYPVVIHEQPYIEHIFSEIYAVPHQIRNYYYRIKILELLLYLDVYELPTEHEKRPYFYKAPVEKVKAIHDFLIAHMDSNYTQEELSKQFGIPQTTMRQCFKSVYGNTISGWLLTYRMNQAAVMLCKERQLTVIEISGRVGYDSPSKFAIAFKRVMGKSPLQYRKEFGS